jgi:quercetin dioxygenase-like cupin family protein
VRSVYVLDGEVTVTAAGRELRADAGSWLQVPVGTAHALAATGDRPAHFLDVHTPGCGLGAFLRGDAAGFDRAPA